MVGFINGKASPPPALSLAQNCQGWNNLPEVGGFLDQDYKTMSEMNVTLNIYNIISKVKNARGSAIHLLTHRERMILKPLVEKGLI